MATAVWMVFGTRKLVGKMHVCNMVALDQFTKDSWGKLSLVVGDMSYPKPFYWKEALTGCGGQELRTDFLWI